MLRAATAAWFLSPEPVEIVELGVIRSLVSHGVLVVACGGGGIPVVRDGGKLKGVEAVIDKDRASALLASELGVETFAISTDISFVYLDYKKPTQRKVWERHCFRIGDSLQGRAFSAREYGPEN